MRRKRGAIVSNLVAVSLAGALALAGCAKDSGSEDGAAAGGGQGKPCELAEKPPAATGGTSAQEKDSGRVDASRFHVGLAYDVGGRGDASFNDAAAAGVDRAEQELGLAGVQEATASPKEAESARRARLSQMASNGRNPIVAVGFDYEKAVNAVAKKFPRTKFAIVDAPAGGPNVTSLVFAEHEGSFLAGVAAAYKSKTCHVGFVGGVDTPLIQKFEAGFVQGAKAAAPDITIESDYLTPAGDISGFQDPAKGNLKAKGQLDKGADVVYHAAGASGKGVFQAVKAAGAKAIGVDSDQYKDKTLAGVRDVIMTSMVKRVDVAVYDFIRAVAKNDLSTLPEVFDFSVDGVGYATSGGQVDDIADVLDGYKQQIVDGKIKVSDKPE